MTTLGRALLYIGVAALAIFAGFLLQNTKTSSTPKHIAQNVHVTNDGASLILETTLPDLQGTNQSVSQWKGKVLVVNFWATWCEPCRREMPEFIELQDELRDRGLLFIGIALDQKSKVQQYSKEIGVNYPILLGGIKAMELAEAAGNRYSVLPFTVIFNRNGEIVSTHVGRIARDKLEPILKPLL
ncbi:MAG: TlpA family protein disulfide reductase [Nitrosomonadaceae bacterium]